jgi:anti-sigma B factor antagonist
MKLQVREKGPIRILDLEGNLTIGLEDLALRDAFRELVKEGGSRFILNLGQVGYVDSSGLGEIVACKKRALQNGGDVILLNPSPRVFELLQLSRLTEVFQIFRDEDQATGSF